MDESVGNQQSKTRVQLDLAPAEVERMNWIMQVCGMDTRKDLFNNALTLLEWAVTEVAQGKEIASFDPDTKERTVVTMPIFRNARATGRKAPR